MKNDEIIDEREYLEFVCVGDQVYRVCKVRRNVHFYDNIDLEVFL